ncbi:UNVERIFIED_CONTAM: hypothetical protein Sradi_7018600 [Sesamum radiatum]|uniref:CCHC-type domain-containing protein n=1 Tax=Sesamum radiatum TaxID=300843 RepID=A0AAW2JAH2_SESRA
MVYGLRIRRHIIYFWWAGSCPKSNLNFEALATSIKGMLDPVKGLDIRRLEEGRFLLRFHHIIDRNRALDGCPWSFKKNTLILSSVGINENPMHVDLNWCEFYVHIHDLPLSKMNLGVAELIGNSIGKFRDLEMEDAGRAWGSSLRMRVAINVTQPLVRALRVCTRTGDELVVSFTYERLQNFCYLCGRLGHIDTYCELRFEEGFLDPGQNMPYGTWLRAPPSSWGTRKLGKLPNSSPARCSNHPEPVRGPGIFEFGMGQAPRQESDIRGPLGVHAGPSAIRSKQQGNSEDGVHSIAVQSHVQLPRTEPLCSGDEQADSLGSFVPNTVAPVEVEPYFPTCNHEGHPSIPEIVGWEEVALFLVSQGKEIPMELERALIPVPVQFAVGARRLCASRGRGRR